MLPKKQETHMRLLIHRTETGHSFNLAKLLNLREIKRMTTTAEC